jgi:hypothetical protein
VLYGCHEPGHYEAGTVGRSRCNNAFPGYLSGRGMRTRPPLVVAPAGSSGDSSTADSRQLLGAPHAQPTLRQPFGCADGLIRKAIIRDGD